MLCPTCKNEMIKVDLANEWMCPSCKHCPRCDKKGTVIDKFRGVMACEKCQKAVQEKYHPMSGFFMNDDKREYFATPFWKIMGLKAKPEEARMEKEMKRRGLTYLDLQRYRNLHGRFDSTPIKKQLERGELYGKPDPTYHRG